MKPSLPGSPELHQQFFQNKLSKKTPILAVFLGGSRLYMNDTGSPPPHPNTPPDWDGVIIVSTKYDIFILLNYHRSYLMRSLSMEEEENGQTNLKVPDPDSPLWPEFDGVRFAGRDKFLAKRSVKILSLEYFSERDVASPVTAYMIQQATTLSEGAVILHDQWVYKRTDTEPVKHTPQGIFGVTADLILTGACLIGREPYGREIKSKIMAYYEQVTMENPIVASFAKSARFPPSFTSWLTEELSNFYVPLTTTRTRCLGEDCHLSCHSLSINPTFFFGDTSMARSVQYDFPPEANSLCFLAYKDFEGFASEPTRLVSNFSSNSSTFYVSTTRFTGVSREIFCKRSHHAKDEIHGANLASKFFHRVEIPRISTAGQLLYPFWRGTTESDLRLSYARGGHTDSSAIGTVLHVELVKAEDALRAYRKSLSLDAQCERPDDKVQRFFYDRVLDNVRFKEFYGAGVRIRDECIPAKKFLELRWCINGKEYPCLRTLFENALDVTDPKSFQVSSCPIAFGLGDAHGGNILVSSAPQERSGCKVLFVDYELAGFHPVMLDLAKPLYNDVFFKTLYSDLLPATSETGLNYEVTNGTIIVQFSPVIDIMAQAVLNIKTRYLIGPLCDEVENIGISLETFVPLLSNALLLCATLTRNFVKDEKALIRNFTAGILLAGAMDWVQLGEGFQRLGFDGRCWQMLNKGERCKVASS